MPRRVQDIVPASRRSIRDIPGPRESVAKKTSDKAPEKRRADKAEDAAVKKEDREEIIQIKRMPISPPPPPDVMPKAAKPRKKRKFPWVLAVAGSVVILAGIAFFVSGHFARATFTIVPRSIPVQVNTTYAIPGIPSPSSRISYEVVSVQGLASSTVPAKLGAAVNNKAQGTVTIYNSYSKTSQRLVAGTRFSGTSGLVYRLTSSVVVPGYATLAGGGIKPGSINAALVAEGAGEQYNVSRTDSVSDLKIILYKGTTKYTTIYAQLATDLTGGYVGAQTTVPPATLASTTSILQGTLAASLLDRAMRSVPAGYVMYPNAYVTSFSAPATTGIDASSARVTVGGTIYSFIFKKADLAALLAGSSSTASFGSLAFDTPGLDELSVNLVNPKEFSPVKKNPIVVKISGAFKLVGSVPVDALKQAFAGVSLSKTGDILRRYAQAISVSDSSGEISPPWVGSVPADKANIEINVKNPR